MMQVAALLQSNTVFRRDRAVIRLELFVDDIHRGGALILIGGTDGHDEMNVTVAEMAKRHITKRIRPTLCQSRSNTIHVFICDRDRQADIERDWRAERLDQGLDVIADGP